MPGTLQDPDLQRFATTGDATAFRTLVERHLPAVRATAARVLGPRAHLADDVAQTVFIHLARNAARLPADLVLSAWLHGCASKSALKIIRGEVRRSRREAIAAADKAAMETREKEPPLFLLDQALLKLPDSDRDALALRFFDRCGMKEVGLRLGISPAAAQKRIERALEKLRARLHPAGSAGSMASVALLWSSRTPSPISPALVDTTVSAGLAAIPTGKSLTTIALIAMSSTKPLLLGAAALVAVGTTAYLMNRQPETAAPPAATSSSAVVSARRGNDDAAARQRGTARPLDLDAKLKKFDSILKIADPGSRITELNRFLGQLDSADYPVVIAYLKEKGPGETNATNLANRDGEDFVPVELSLILSSWIKADGKTAADYIAGNYPLGSRTSLTAWESWAASDPSAAIAWAKKHSGGELVAMVGALAASDPDQAQKLALELPDPEAREAAIANVAASKAKGGQAALREWIATLPDPRAQGAAARVALAEFRSFRPTDDSASPKETMEWLASASIVPGGNYGSFVSQRWANQDCAGAIAYYEAMPEGPLRTQFRSGLIEASTSNAEARKYLNEHPEASK